MSAAWLKRFYVGVVPPKLKFFVKTIELRWRPRPMMSSDEIVIVRSILTAIDPQRVLEFGAGGSTLYFSKYLSPEAHWCSVEFDPHWFEFLRQLIPRNVTLSLCKEDDIGETIGSAIDSADLILVDGGSNRARLLELIGQRNKVACILLHDSWRPAYKDSIERFAFRQYLSRPYGVTIGREYEAGGLVLLRQQ